MKLTYLSQILKIIWSKLGGTDHVGSHWCDTLPQFLVSFMAMMYPSGSLIVLLNFGFVFGLVLYGFQFVWLSFGFHDSIVPSSLSFVLFLSSNKFDRFKNKIKK